MCERRERAAQLRKRESKCQRVRLGESARRGGSLKFMGDLGVCSCSWSIDTLTRTPAETRARRLNKTREHIHD